MAWHSAIRKTAHPSWVCLCAALSLRVVVGVPVYTHAVECCDRMHTHPRPLVREGPYGCFCNGFALTMSGGRWAVLFRKRTFTCPSARTSTQVMPQL